MEDLKKTSGLDLKLDVKKCSLALGEGITKVTPAVRDLKNMREVLVQKDLTSPKELYYMYRDLHKVKDEADIRKNKLRYDVTIIRHDRLGNEYMKTAGHYHPGDFGELYEVLYGSGWCMMQKANKKDHRVIEDVILMKAKAGDKIVIPPRYGHILINVGNEPLVTSNWVSSEFSSEYDLYKKSCGAAYFVFEDNKIERFEVNPYYAHVSKMRVGYPAKEINNFGLKAGEPMYPLLYNDVKKLVFLNSPLKYDYSDVFVFQ